MIDVLADTEAIRERVDRVLADDLYWFPVRHHSPTVARFVGEAVRKRTPKVIFIEAPAEAQPLVEHVAAAGTKPPVAIYSSYRDDDDVLGLAGIASAADDIPPKFPCWYPMTAYSPEYVAMTAARDVGADVVFMDLPHYGLLKRADSDPQQAKSDDDALLSRSDFYARLAEAGGYRSWNEAWDVLFERSEGDLERYRRELTTFCAAARHTTPAARIAGDDTLPRERFMWQTIKRELAERKLSSGDAMVVCGGFHVFLDRDDATAPPALPPGTVHCTLVPYSFFRISEQSGYGAGNRAPQYYQRLWDGSRRGTPRSETLTEHVTHVLAAARRAGERLAAADSIAVVHHTHLLAQLRGRREPVLDDLHDALVTCCVKGAPDTDGAPLLAAMAKSDVGTALGKVTAAVGRLPIVDDYYREIERLDLGSLIAHEKMARLTLDKREPADGGRSAFLHRLIYLGAPIGDVKRSGDPFGQSIFKEHWQLTWNPKIEDALVERSLDGDTVETAALHRLAQNVASAAQDALRACRELVHAVDMDMPAMVTHAEEACGHAIDHDGRFFSLAGALSSLLVLDRYAAYRKLGRRELLELVERAYDRACFAMPEAAAVPADDQPEVVKGLRILGELVLQRDDLDASLFASHARTAADVSTMPYLRGAFLGVLVEIRQLEAPALAHELSLYAQGPPDKQLEAGDFLNGVLAVSRMAVMLGATELVAAVDEVLRRVDGDTFLAMAPRLRAAISELRRAQLDAFAEEVGKLYGTTPERLTAELHTSAESAALIAAIDRDVARIMEAWAFG